MSPPPPAADSTLPPRPSLPEVFRTIPVAASGGVWRKIGAFAGPGYLVAVGYMDPGNWATDLAGGSAFGYTLLSVILLSNLMAMVLQSLAAQARHRRRARSRPGLPRPLLAGRSASRSGLLCELAIIACDLAEVIGTAIALQLLFGIPLVWGVALTALDVLLILALQRFGFRKLEAFVIALLIIIAGCFAAELVLSRRHRGHRRRPDPAH